VRVNLATFSGSAMAKRTTEAYLVHDLVVHGEYIFRQCHGKAYH